MLKYKKILPIVTAVILLAILVPHNLARANVLTDTIASEMNTLILGFVGGIIGWGAQLLDKFIQYQPVRNVFFVDESWKQIRNFVNMFFILVLIVMAFGTIFDIKKYTWRKMLPAFLIAALLVNFSLAIGQYIVEVANGLSSVFLKDIGSISEVFGRGSRIVTLASSGKTNIVDGAGSVVITAFFSIIFLAIAALALVSVAIFVMMRTLVIWFLLIISPIAWLGYALPNLRQKTWGTWWNHFLCWCFFLPYYLFFFMFATIFIRNKANIPPVSDTGTLFTGSSMTANDFLLYGVSLVFMIGGLVYAKKLACASGTYVSTVMGTVESGVRKYAPGAAYVRGGAAGLKERGAEIQEKGLFGFGGAQRGRLDEATARGLITGVPGPGQIPGAREEASRAMSTEVDKEVKRLQALNLNLDQLNEKLKSSNKPERFAALKLKAESGWLQAPDADFIAKTVREVGGGRTAVGASIIASAKKGKFHEMAASTAEKERIFSRFLAEDKELAKAFGLDMADNRELVGETGEIFAKKLLDLYSTEAKDVRNKVEESIQKNLVNFAKTRPERAAFLQDDKKDKLLKKLLAKQMYEDGEINNYEKYITAANLFGGESETQSMDMFRKIAKDDPITSAEIEFRQAIGNTDPIYTPQTSAEQAIFTSKLSDKIKKVNAKQLADADKDSRWKQPWFLDALQTKIDGLQKADPATPFLPKGGIDPKTNQKATSARKAIPGGGERFIQSLKRAVGEDLEKLGVVSKLKTPLPTETPL